MTTRRQPRRRRSSTTTDDRRSLPAGFRYHGAGIQGAVYRHGVRVREQFPIDTDDRDLIAWRDHAAADLQVRVPAPQPRAQSGTFAADVKRYLTAVAALPDIRGRTYHMTLWAQIFGTRRRHTIRPDEIRAVRDRWLTVGPKRKYVKGRGWMDLPKALSPSSVCNRMRALENFFTVMDPGGYNPVRQVPEPREQSPRPRGLPYQLVDAILEAMPNRGQGLRGQKRTALSKTKARLRLMAYTGLTHGQIGALIRGDLQEDPPAVHVHDRRKGAGAAGGWRPVPAEAVSAMRDFVAADAWGSFSRASAWKSFQRAVTEFNKTLEPKDRLKGIRPYDLRHSYGTIVLQQTGDLKATQRALGHASDKTTSRYALAALEPWLAGAMAKVSGLRQTIAPERK